MNQTAPNQEVINQEGESCFCTLQALLCFCFFIGVLKIVAFLKTILASYFRRRLDLKKRYGGGWALVTGGSEGIGEAIALELAKQGLNLILVSRNMDKLNKAKESILSIVPNIEIQIHSIDLANLSNEGQYRQSFGHIFDKDISILVNNVGYFTPDYFLNIPYQTIRTQAKLNFFPIAVLTRLFLEKAKKRGNKSGLINMSSASGMIIMRGTAHYSATKTYDDAFSESINLEVNHNIDVLTVRPFFVSTPMTRNTTSSTHATASQTAKETVDSLGQVDICYGPFIHRLSAAMVNLTHEKIVTFSISKILADFKKSYNKQD